LSRPVATIVVAQLLATSLWFSPNSAADDLIRDWALDATGIGWLTGAVQAGFIGGTLLFALSGLADRFRASRIFVFSAIAGALANAGFALLAQGLYDGLAWRLAVGLCLAGIYPLGMKMVVSWVGDRAGAALGLLIGMLTLGTALPHGIRAIGATLDWQPVVAVSSLLALLAAVLVGRLGDGPSLPPPARAGAAAWGRVWSVFRIPAFRASALGYFGHMWELYAFWTVVPWLVADLLREGAAPLRSGLSFLVIACGAAGCVMAGQWSRRIGSARVAAIALAVSGAMCVVYPLMQSLPVWLRLLALCVWGFAVVADSAQFSAMSARACPPGQVGSALAVQNSIGFGITVAAIALSTALIDDFGARVSWILAIGPVLGLIALRPVLRPASPG
jgi:MFS family permease